MSILLIISALFFTVFVAIRPFEIKKLPLNMASGAILSIIVLLAFQVIDFDTLKFGILGNDQLKPWEIITIFFTVAYVSISVDVTGLFDYLAYRIVRKAKGNGNRLFLFFYLFACVLTVFTSNDIVILTLTPIIFYLKKHSNVHIIPLLFAEFFGANTLSMLLYIGNPTNIIVGNALGLGFIEYTRIMWFPTLVAALSNFFLLRLFFRNQITREYALNPTSHFSVRNWADAILSASLMFVMLTLLALSQWIEIPIWVITLFFAFLFVIEDSVFSIYYIIKHKRLSLTQIELDKEVYHIPQEKNEVLIVTRRVPWRILPFIVTFFILVQGLNEYGVVSWMAETISGLSTSLGTAIAFNGFFSLILANIINNQPMTILLTNVLISDGFVVSDLIFQGSAYAIVIASNLGANITLVGALAGLMWKKILHSHGLEINYLNFLKKGIVITPLVFVVTLVSLFIVLG